MPDERAIPLTIYLVKKTAPKDEILTTDHPKNLKTYPVRTGKTRLGTLYLKPPTKHPPSWLHLFNNIITETILNASTSALLIANAAHRTFALTFGYGRSLLSPASIEEQFGLKITLNSISPDNIRTVDHLSLDTAQHTRTQASKTTPIREFGLDIDQDLLRAVTGPPLDDTLGRNLTGRDNLQTTVKLTLADLPALLEKLLAAYQKQDYKHDYPWVDHISQVKDPTLITSLDNALQDKLRAHNLDGTWLAVPEIIDWARTSTFRYRDRTNAPAYEDLHLNDFLQQLRHPERVEVEALKRYYTYAISNENDQALTHWPIYQCLYAELTKNNQTYVLTNGAWYRISNDFVNDVNNAVNAIPASTITFPPYTDANEAAYNDRLAHTNPAFTLMDEQLIMYPGGTDKIELCDVYTTNHEFVHIKRYEGSSPLSHLFAQGVVSAEAFLEDHEFRKRANQRLPPSHQWQDPDERPNPRDYTVVYGIISRSVKPLTLPFFSKVTLRNAQRRLDRDGYHIAIGKIPNQKPTTPAGQP